ncbi:MAG: hydantoinase B/oxoprolinase family protein [Chromatiales bacterium]|jgi:N-methylhydantoinase B|nr:hydantoinase B/oxoprolinase family protein [Chromatiales bacterium]
MGNREFDPILVEVVKHELAAITEEMAIAVWKTGRSAMVRSGDFATALCDAKGRLIGQGYAAPFQLGFFMEAMRYLLAKFPDGLEKGDVIVTNDPYAGITHMPDVLVVAPAFWRDELVGYTLAYSHHTDIGGRFPGGFSSQCTVAYEEGLRIPTLRLYERGERNAALLDTILGNVRMADEWLGDLEAKVAGCWRGEQELNTLLDRYDVRTLDECCNYLIDASERATRQAIGDIPDGSYAYRDVLEDDGLSDSHVALPLAVTITVSADTMVVDFAGTAAQAPGAINLPFSMTQAAVYAVVKSLVGPEVLTNVGFEKPISVRAPTGTLVNPEFPAAVGGRAPLFFGLMDMMHRTLAQAVPERSPVPGEGGDVLHFTGSKPDGTPFALLDLFFGGWGGRPNADGIDGVAPMAFGSYGTVPAEIMEREFPVLVEGFGYVEDSAGAGRYRGSVAIYKQWRFLASGKAMVRTNRLTRPSGGLQGGGPGALSRNIRNPNSVNEAVLTNRAHIHLDLEEGDVLYHEIAGSGGHGDPLTRDPERVVQDVLDEKVSAQAAAETYGVVLHANALTVDEAATLALRATRAG